MYVSIRTYMYSSGSLISIDINNTIVYKYTTMGWSLALVQGLEVVVREAVFPIRNYGQQDAGKAGGLFYPLL